MKCCRCKSDKEVLEFINNYTLMPICKECHNKDMELINDKIKSREMKSKDGANVSFIIDYGDMK